MSLRSVLVSVSMLKPTEEFIEQNLREVENNIDEDPMNWPAIYISKEYYILDGHHRYQIALRSRMQYVRAHIFNYFSDQIKVYKYGTDTPLSKHKLMSIYTTGKLLKPKSTKHVVEAYNIEY